MLVIKGGRLVDPAKRINRPGVVAVDGRKIIHVGAEANLPKEARGAEVFDAHGCLVLPGLVDLHVHFREPGHEYRETLASGTRAAAAGGVTTAVAMPNTEPTMDNAQVLEFVTKQAHEHGSITVLPAGAISKGRRGEELAELGEMADAGAVAFTDDGGCVMDAGLMRRALEYARGLKRPLFQHAEDHNLAAHGLMHEGAVAVRLGLPAIPHAAEDVIVARDIELAALTGAQLHFCHVSSSGAVRMIARAQRKGLRVTGEVTPHHLMLTDEALGDFDTNFKVSPPLRTNEDRQALRRALKEGVLAAVATDHAPHASHEKRVEFEIANSGVIGLETMLPVTLSLVWDGVLNLSTLVYRLTAGPAAIIGQNAGTLAAGADADICVLDPLAEWVIDPDKFQSKSRNTPFAGRKVKGRVVRTMSRGRWVYRWD